MYKTAHLAQFLVQGKWEGLVPDDVKGGWGSLLADFSSHFLHESVLTLDTGLSLLFFLL